jgi:hypothetical protein
VIFDLCRASQSKSEHRAHWGPRCDLARGQCYDF